LRGEALSAEHVGSYARRCVIGVGEKLKTRVEKGKENQDKVWNELGCDLIEALKAHVMVFIYRCFSEVVEKVNKEEIGTIGEVLRKMLIVFGGMEIINNYGWGETTKQEIENLKINILKKVGELRKDVIGLVDGFDIPDSVLNSVLGVYDGNVYERLYEAAKGSVLNARDPFDGYEEHLKPLLDLDYLKSGKERSRELGSGMVLKSKV